ncbi:MAG: prepilin-type N-terminal cleavage/methylation domain-containing protein [Candidatus Hydrogenedentes bacterium]|nr:prepilin-type N-terminal cleavage/methylation domain-containing protein [Candidatus Hydrogenedentota bacterium]
MRNQGFTLLELMISLSILAVIGALGLVALNSSTSAMAVSQAKGDVQRGVRDVVLAMSRELQLASNNGDASLSPPLVPVAIVDNPATGSPVEVVFQVPADGTGRVWSRAIRFRFENEDTNGNARLDSGEDLNGDGLLQRRVMRLQDRNGDGDFSDGGEQSPVGGFNNLSNVQFNLAGDLLTVTVTATRLVGTRRTAPVTATSSNRIYLVN